MSVALYTDVHIDGAAANDLRRRGVDLMIPADDDQGRTPDPLLLDHASRLGRVLVTHDRGLLALAARRQRRGPAFFGLIWVPSDRLTVGHLIDELEIVAGATDPSDWQSTIMYFPLSVRR